ncbi:MAG: hypothetical protein L6R42_006162 [Xanthoria sp. 1 TBL-2021]|nr:MAG: hypothetical protein L6R42_006162 [Xanthoria sp. 1 TBL-2021]
MSSSLPTPDPDETIQRVLFLCPTVHIYTVPPLTSTKGYTTTGWSPLLAPTASNPTPTAITTRLRVLETSSSTPATTSSSASSEFNNIKTTILLEDPTSGDLFAAAPYTTPATVEAVLDSARFFAVRVEGEGGRKAVLGIGFEDRSEAIDFGICLQEALKVMGIEKDVMNGAAAIKGGRRGGVGGAKEVKKEVGKASWSLKEGEMIKVEIGGMGVKRKEPFEGGGKDGESALFSIKPPPQNPSMEAMPFLPPPPSAQEVKAESRRSRGLVIPEKGSAADLGFDDGEFGEFQ